MNRIIRLLIMAGIIALAGPSGVVHAKCTKPFKGTVTGSFFFKDCTGDVPEGALCLHDDVTGTLTHLGLVTGAFEVVFDLAKFDENGCGPISKRGSFVAANGDRLDIEAEGTFCFSTLIATYEFRITGGTGRFAGATGGGTWLVPPPETFDGVAGVGDEYFDGVIVTSK